MKWEQIPYKQRQQIKAQLIALHGLVCCICGRPIRSMKEATIEHKKKQRNGGSHELSNLGLAHARCNYSDNHDDIDERSRIIDNSAFF